MVKSIFLNTGEEVLVDNEDYPVVARYSWRKISLKHYAGTTVKFPDGTERTLYMHSLILATSTHVDHDDMNVWNNQKGNLRKATYQQNSWNKGKQRSRHGEPASKYKGVIKCKKASGETYWGVVIKTTAKGVTPAKYIRRGPFKYEDDAAREYNKEIVKLRGEWAWVNPLPETTHANPQ
jgi:hypothetical protein